MKGIAKRLANHVKSKHKVIENSQECIRIKRKVLIRVARRPEHQQSEDKSKLKGKFFESVKHVLHGIRMKEALLSLKNKFNLEALQSRLRPSTSQQLDENNHDSSEQPVELFASFEDLAGQEEPLYMPLQF